MTQIPERSSFLTVLQFIGMALVWGASFLFMKVALAGMSFGQIVWGREVLGALTLGIVMLIGRHRLPKEPVVWLHFLVIGITNCALPHLLFVWAEQHISSSLAGIYNATTPIATAILAAAVFRVEKIGGRQLFGIALGIVGVIVILAPWTITGESSLYGQLAVIAASVSYGIAIPYLRKFIGPRPISGTTVAFMSVGMAAGIMLLLSPVLLPGPISLNWEIVVSMVLLGSAGTGIAYVWNIGVIRAWGPTRQSTVTYLIPVVAVVLGVLVLGETLDWNEPVGAALVLLGILFVQGTAWARRRPAISLPPA